jgi:hypothetical protein
MSLYIRLNKEINPQQLLQKLQHKISEHGKNNSLKDSILCIEIRNVSHAVDDITGETIKRLEHNE